MPSISKRAFRLATVGIATGCPLHAPRFCRDDQAAEEHMGQRSVTVALSSVVDNDCTRSMLDGPAVPMVLGR